MARVGTPNLNLGTWLDGENPGAGDQATDNTGLNGNWIKLDLAVGTEHNSNGTHKDDKITGANLKNTIVDGATLEASAASGAKVFRVKDLGVTTDKINDLAVTTGKIADDAVDAVKLKDDATVDANRAVTTNHIRDLAVSTAKIADDAVTAAKIAHDNKRTQIPFVFVFDSAVHDTFAKVDGVATTVSLGVPMPHAGSVIKVQACASAGVVDTYATTYGTLAFIAGDRLTFRIDASAAVTIYLYKNGALWSTLGASLEGGAAPFIVSMLVEFDD